MPKPSKAPSPPPKESSRPSLGRSPASMMKRISDKPDQQWCPRLDIEFDAFCDPQNPKAITFKEITNASELIKERVPPTPLLKSRCWPFFGCELYYKVETQHKTGSFCERGALCTLLSLTKTQQDSGVVAASLGNFGMALAYHAKKLNIRARIIYPENTPTFYVTKCKEYGARVIVQGESFTEARHEAFVLAMDLGTTFINGYDHPAMIAGAGTIGLEIMDELPDVEVIIAPVGGGALIAGIAAAARHINPHVNIYGVEPEKCCCFFKAMEKEGIYETDVGSSIAGTLGIPMAGCNSFHTAKSLINKMILVDDDWISRAICHFAEEEKMVAEGAGATALASLFAIPNVLPELKGKKVACIISGGNIHNISILTRAMDRGRALDGRMIKLVMNIPADDTAYHTHVLSMIANVGCNVLQCYTEHAWIVDNDLRNINLHLVIETINLEHACQLKRVMTKLFPDQCDFMEEPFSPIPICVCYPKKQYHH